MVSPGPTHTDGTEPMRAMPDEHGSHTPPGRAAEPEEIAAVIAFPAGDAASFITSAIVPAGGGMTAA